MKILGRKGIGRKIKEINENVKEINENLKEINENLKKSYKTYRKTRIPKSIESQRSGLWGKIIIFILKI